MKNMKSDNFTKWEKTRVKGKWRYVIINTFAATVGGSIGSILLDWLVKKEIGYPNFILFLTIGITISFFSWYYTERKYQEHLINKKLDEFPNQ